MRVNSLNEGTEGPTVSVLVPVYNAGEYLVACLDSIVGQTYGRLQVVLVDDGSTDGSGRVCDEYAERDRRVEVYHKANGGVAAARNDLLARIRGDYFLYVDADDWIERGMVEFLVRMAQKHDADITTCSMARGCAAGAVAEPEIWGQEQTVREFIMHRRMTGSLCNKLVKTSLLHNEPQFRCGISYGEDALFVWGLLRHLRRTVYTTAPLYHYRSNPGSLSHQAYASKRGSHVVWKTIAEETEREWPQFRGIGRTMYALADMWLLYFAADSGHEMDAEVRGLRRHVRRELWRMVRAPYLRRNERLFAPVAAGPYALTRAVIRRWGIGR